MNPVRVIRASSRKGGGRQYAIRFYSMPDGRRRTMRVAGPKAVADDAARWVARMLQSRSLGMPDSPDVAAWVASRPPAMRRKLLEFGVIDAASTAQTKPIAVVIEEWAASLAARGATPKRVRDERARVLRVVQLGGVETPRELTVAAVERAMEAMRTGVPFAVKSPRSGESGQRIRHYAPHTIGGHRAAARSFSRWMHARGVLHADPLAYLPAVPVAVVRERRALSLDEQRFLVAFVASSRLHRTRVVDKPRPQDNGGGSNRGVRTTWPDGPERALVYRFALETGFRAGEIASLTRASFSLEGDRPSVTIAARNAKNRRPFTMRLRDDTAAQLRVFLARKAPAAPAFNMPPSTETAAMLRYDLAAARAAWIEAAWSPAEGRRREESDFLAAVDASGAVIDFHALRTSFITGLARAGVPLQQAQRLARHSDPRLTSSIYTKLGEDDLDAALDRLPSLDVQAVRAATGTADRCAPDALQSSEIRRFGLARDDTETPGESCKKLTRIPGESGDFGGMDTR